MKGIIYSLLFGVCLSSALGVVLHNPPAGRCPKDNSYYDSYAHIDCHKFYICDWGYGIERDCAMASATERLVFNPKLQVCDWKDAAIKDGAVCRDSSGSSTSAPSTASPPTTLAPGVCPPNNEYYHSYPHADCTKFYKCDWGKGVQFDCPWANTAQTERLVFNPKLQVCDWRNAAIKDGAVCAATTSTTTTPKPTTTTTKSTTTSTTQATTTLPTGVCPPNNEYYHSYAHADCTKFYKCDWGKGVQFDCPWANTAQTERLVFNPKLQVCDWRNAAIKDGAVCAATTSTTTTPKPTTTTTKSTTTSTTQATTTLPTGVCPPNNEYYHSYAHADCTKFYKCDWGKGVQFDCPWANTAQTERLVFNPKLQVCDWRNAAIKDGAVCAATTSTITTPKPTTTTTKSTTTSTTQATTTLPTGVCPPNNEYYHSYPHADCTKFYKCDWGKGVQFDCPWANTAQTERLVFNPKLQVCDWRNAAIKDGAVCAATTSTTTTPKPTTTTTKSTTTSTTQATTTLPTGVCPPNNEYYHSYAHADCTKFYKCDWGKGVQFDCPWANTAQTERLVFNPKLQVCDWRNAAIKDGAVCAATTSTTTTPKPTTTTTKSTTTSTTQATTTLPTGVCPPNNEYYHSYAHADCTKFYKCDWGKGVQFDCPWANTAQTERLVFNPKLQVCDWRNAAIKDGAVCAATTSTITTPKPTTTTTKSTTTSTTQATTTLPTGVCPPNNEYYHSYPHADCTKFYKCDWGKGVQFDCPWANTAQTERLVFNPKLQVCDWRNAAIKDGAVCAATTSTTTTPKPTTTTTKSTTTSTTQATTTLPTGVCPPNNEYYHSYAHADCTKFYKCDWGKGVQFDCPWANTAQTERLVFNPKLQVCDWRNAAIKDGAVCAATTSTITTPKPTTTTTKSTTTSTTRAPITLPTGVCPPNNEYYHSYAHADCSKFYKCDWGKGVQFDCPWANTAQTERLVFNPKLQVCDWRNAAIKDGAVCAVVSTPTPKPTTTTKSPVTSVPSGKCPPGNEYYHSYAHESNCSKFYKCDWGKGVEFDCPWANTAETERLVFNPKLQVCDWKVDAIKSGAQC